MNNGPIIILKGKLALTDFSNMTMEPVSDGNLNG